MKRRLLCALLCLCIVLGMMTLPVFADKLDSKDLDWGLTLRADEITPTGMTVVLSQSGGNYAGVLEYGSAYHVEVLTDDGWKSVPYIDEDVAWTMEAYSIPPESIFRKEINWASLYGELPAGRYRYVKNIMDFCDGADGYDHADFYAEFAITDPHTCVSEDQDLLCDICLGIVDHDCTDEVPDTKCDICGKKVSDKDVFRVISKTDWLGSWGSNRGLMTETEPGIYQVTYRNVQPGSYEIWVGKNDDVLETWGDQDGALSFTVEQQSDVTVEFTLEDGIGTLSVQVDVIDSLEKPVYRVTGNADWMGSWDPANDLGIMSEVEPGIYRKDFLDVPPGAYELKITKDGKWDNAYGTENGQNYTFTVYEKRKVTVDFTIKDGVGVIAVYGIGAYLDEDEDQEKSSDTNDLAVELPAVVLLTCAAALSLLFRKRDCL